MRLVATAISKGSGGSALPETSLEMVSRRALLTEMETEQRPTVLSLIVSGRMKPSTGSVTIDGSASRRELRRNIAIVDAPDVSEPHGDVRFADVVAEELMFAGRMPSPWAVRNWLEEHQMSGYARVPMGQLAPETRVRALAELALLRDGVTGLILVSPDRHGGDPFGWWRVATGLAARDVAVLVLAGVASAALIRGAAANAERGANPASEANSEGPTK